MRQKQFDLRCQFSKIFASISLLFSIGCFIKYSLFKRDYFSLARNAKPFYLCSEDQSLSGTNKIDFNFVVIWKNYFWSKLCSLCKNLQEWRLLTWDLNFSGALEFCNMIKIFCNLERHGHGLTVSFSLYLEHIAG